MKAPPIAPIRRALSTPDVDYQEIIWMVFAWRLGMVGIPTISIYLFV